MVAPPVRLNLLLKEVSRSFYLTIRLLPGAIRSQIGLAYLLARATDTIADTEIMPVSQRLEALQSLRERILGIRHKTSNFGEAAHSQHAPLRDTFAKDFKEVHPIEHESLSTPPKIDTRISASERILLERIDERLSMLTTLSPMDRELICDVLSIITSGQELDLKRFAHASPDQIIALLTEEELDDYTWRVAGCVGAFWTRMCRAHLFPHASLDHARLLSNSILFGKGLQLVNILRDLPSDLRHGRCYLPAQALSARDLAPKDLLRPENEARFRPVYEIFLHKAQQDLAAGW